MMFVFPVLFSLVFTTITIGLLILNTFMDGKILGIPLSEEQALSPLIKKNRRQFNITVVGLGLFFILTSFIIFTDQVRPYSQVLFFLLVLLNLTLNKALVHSYKNEFTKIKQQQHWDVPLKSRPHLPEKNYGEKHPAAVPVIWLNVFLAASLIPAVLQLLLPDLFRGFPLVFTLLCPLGQACCLVAYYQQKNRFPETKSDNPETDRQYAQQKLWLNTLVVILAAAILLISWLLVYYFIITGNSHSITFLAIALVIVVMTAAYWYQKKIEVLQLDYYEPATETAPAEQWKWGFYYNPADPRLIVPKKIAAMGWTINTGHPAGKIVAAFFTLPVLITAFIFFWITMRSGYNFFEKGSSIVFDVPLYGTIIEKSSITSVSTLSQLPKTSRTNGYQGLHKTYGNFYVEGYGQSRLYLYNNVDSYILLHLDSQRPAVFILNDRTKELTTELLVKIESWLKNQ